MIRISRLPKPNVLVNDADVWRDAYLLAIAELGADKTNAAKKKAKKAAEAKYAHDEVRTQLQRMFGSKCAFCESHIKHVSFDQIEHFRPKQRFPALCFDWDNLLLACGGCNGAKYKGTKFPEAADGGPFVNPVDEEPNDFFDFKIDPHTQLAELVPKSLRGETTEKELGLNRQDLMQHRSKAVMNIFRLAAAAMKGDDDCRNMLIKNCLPEYEYAAFARSIADRFGIDWRNG
jgi:uncharacterized protein (TIGR02646 family)